MHKIATLRVYIAKFKVPSFTEVQNWAKIDIFLIFSAAAV